MKRFVICLVILTSIPAMAQTPRISDVYSSSHDFTPGGRGPVTSADTRTCIFCHISHNGSTTTGYLWNQRSSTAAYTPYQSPTMSAPLGYPATGLYTKLCLSCHDGTVAPGQSVGLARIPTTGTMVADDVVGIDFRRHHPVGITPVDDGQVYAGLSRTPPTTLNSSVKLPNGVIECTTCHDPHSEFVDATRGKFLVTSNQGSALCLACHDPSRPAPNVLSGWTGAAHQAATNSRTGMYGTVGADACQSCHRPHNATIALPLLSANEENDCLPCHAGAGTAPALPSVMSELSLPYSHPVTTVSGSHVINENTFPLNTNRHSECPDCHNPHRARVTSLSSIPPGVSPPLAGVSGVDGVSGSTAVRPATNEYEICFKCHAFSSNKPQAAPGYSQFGYTPSRVSDSAAADPFNTLLEFNSVSRHNVIQGRIFTSAQVPSIRATLLKLNGAAGRSLAGGTIYCTDCHNNNQARTDGGTQASGVHGSSYAHILERRYEYEPPPATRGGSTPGVTYQSGLAGSYALCYKCHDIDANILQNRSFRYHQLHVSSVRASCATCHDAHGINGAVGGTAAHLINFDTRIVGPSSSGALRFEQTGAITGRCYLTCHGKNHNPLTY